jgi:hypothetical protein
LGLDTETFVCMMMVIITKSTSLNTRRIFTSLNFVLEQSYRDRGRERVTEIEGELVITFLICEKHIIFLFFLTVFQTIIQSLSMHARMRSLDI